MSSNDRQTRINISQKTKNISEIKNQLDGLIGKNVIPDEHLHIFNELHKTLDELIDENEKLNLLAGSSLDVLFRISPTGKVIYISPSVKELLGYETDEIVGRPLIILSRREN
jgi:PAS domain-containing protein